MPGNNIYSPGPTPNTVRSADGKVLTTPEDWELLPPGDAQALADAMLSFLQDSRRMKNDKLLRELDVRLQYPDLEAGLASCFTD